ncbi:MAG: SEC-C metal-binding domain-containing protein [Muribaculaceae bacterium]
MNELPITLTEIIRQYTLNDINHWIRLLGVNVSSKSRKAEKVHYLAKSIVQFPKNVVKHLPTYNLQMILDVIDGKISMNEYKFCFEKIAYHTFGLVYENILIPLTPQFCPELVDVYRPVICEEIEYRNSNGFADYEKYLLGMANIYGCVSPADIVPGFYDSDFAKLNGDNASLVLSQLITALGPLIDVSHNGIDILSPFADSPNFLRKDYERKQFSDDFILAMGEMPSIKFEMRSAKRLQSVMESNGVKPEDIKPAILELWWQKNNRCHPNEFVNIVQRISRDLDALQGILSSATVFLNDVPIWGFNGHSSIESLEIEEKRKQSLRQRKIFEPDPAPMPISFGKKPGRNDPCPCGSGKKYKHCCGR